MRGTWDDLVTRHSAIMDRYDAQKKVGLIVDEWGTWYDPEPGTNPGFLYQQNTLRDALVAGVTLNIFKPALRPRENGLHRAQLANVLQAMVLTDNEKIDRPHRATGCSKMFKRPSRCDVAAGRIEMRGFTNSIRRKFRRSVFRPRVDMAGKIHVTLCKPESKSTAEISCELQGAKAQKDFRPCPDRARDEFATTRFDQPDNVKPVEFYCVQNDCQRICHDAACEIGRGFGIELNEGLRGFLRRSGITIDYCHWLKRGSILGKNRSTRISIVRP